ncbi:MAG TPA: ABC transporter ATP-binding protein [Ktedonobacteraceae bacterium]|jgi:branched-chain amino acid transport system ATP-binding protein
MTQTPSQSVVPTSALRLQSVGKHFGGVEAVRDVTLDIAYGERRVILGPNGAGKSTLFNLVAGEFKPSAGTIILFDKDVTGLSTQYRARHGLTRTYQTTHLFNGLSTLDNLFLAVRGIKPKRMSLLRPRDNDRHVAQARQVAVQVGLEAALERKVGVLSHGEQRQLELGMALAGEPRMIILDEPAAGLSQGERARLTELILGLDPTITVMLIEHDMDVALQIAQVVTVMHNGRVIVNGTPDEIRGNALVHELYLGEHHE